MGNNYKRIKQIGNGMKQVKVQEPGKSSQVTHEKGKYMTNLSSKGASFIFGLQGMIFFKKDF